MSELKLKKKSITPIIEWHMLDKKKYVPLNLLSQFTIRASLYPLTVVKTKIQIQKGNTIYNGTFDAFRKIYKAEGSSGLYKGFWISSFQIFTRVAYFGAYEKTRNILSSYDLAENNYIKSFIAGITASAVGQGFNVPLDVVSQQLMVIGQAKFGADGTKKVVNPLKINYENLSRTQITKEIIGKIWKADGIRGFYRAYWISLAMFGPNSAIWWSCYQLYQDLLAPILPDQTSSLLAQCMAGTMSGLSVAVLTTPIDVVRSRIQINRNKSLGETVKILWKEERFGLFKKGLSARSTQSVMFGLTVILGYETIKRLSVKDEFKDQITW